MDRQFEEILERQASPSRIEPSHRVLTAQHRDDLEVDQLGGGEILTAEVPARSVAVGTVVAQRGRQHARVNDEHGRFGRLWPRPSA